MKKKYIIVLIFAICALAASAKGQIFTNFGVVISAQPRAIVQINGNALITGGETSFADKAELHIKGALTLEVGALIFTGASSGFVTNDCYIGAQGELRRLGSGTLFLNRFTQNKGLIVNEGIIEYGLP